MLMFDEMLSVYSGHAAIFMPPNFGEVEGAYWFGPVCPSVSPSVRNTLAAEKLKNRLC